ncbi:HAMP domain-containing protein [bacterium]|nr:HAMP domain-containing protein [bacterium]
MKKRVLKNIALIALILCVTLFLVLKHIGSMRDHQRAIAFFQENIDNFTRLYRLTASIFQQQQLLRVQGGDPAEIFADIDQIQAMTGKTIADLGDDKLTETCRSCHVRMGDEKWRKLQPQYADLALAMDVYRQAFVAVDRDLARKVGMVGADPSLTKSAERLLAETHHAEKSLNKIVSHVRDEHQEWAARTGNITLIVIVTGFIAVLLLVVRFVRTTLTPVLDLERATRTLAAGKYPERIEVRTNDEVERLAGAFNHMVASLKEMSRERESLLHQTQELNATLEDRVAAVRDELRRAQEHLIRSETLSAVGTLASGVAHEINNPIHVIIGLVNLIQRDIEADSPLAQDLRMVESEAARCQTIVSSLLDFARKREGELTDTDINELVESSLTLLRAQLEKRGVRVETVFDKSLPPLLADPNKLKQVLVNMYLNAQHAMENGGSLTVRTGPSRNGKAGVRVEIADSGEGIPEDIRARIFEPFFTTKKGRDGTGLGLAICHRIIDEHGGRIELESSPGQGTTFIITLPFRPPADQTDPSDAFEEARP